jgi:selenocysteine lyase/cysteine desulfurase
MRARCRFGPRAGVLYLRRELGEELLPYKLRPSSDVLPSYGNCQGNRWELGTQNYEALAGAAAAVRYLASLSTRVCSGVACVCWKHLLSVVT